MPQSEWSTKSRNERASALMPQGNALWTHLAASHSAGLTNRKKLPNWLHSWHRTELRQSPEVSTSSMAGQSRQCEKGALLTITVSLISAARCKDLAVSHRIRSCIRVPGPTTSICEE